jgi:hypothetical protein
MPLAVSTRPSDGVQPAHEPARQPPRRHHVRGESVGRRTIRILTQCGRIRLAQLWNVEPARGYAR